MESKTLHRPRRTLQAFSRGSDIDELVLLVFGRMQAGDGYMFLILLELGLQLGSDRIWILQLGSDRIGIVVFAKLD